MPDRRGGGILGVLAVIGLVTACSAGGHTPVPSSATPSPTNPPALTATPTVTPTATLPPTPTPIDYSPMVEQVKQYLTYTADRFGYDLAIGFEDVETSQQESINSDGRYHAMSSFKGPLAVQYLWLLEQGKIQEQPHDREHIERMLSVSANPDTSCIFERVGGIAAFNDWLADQGFARGDNFVLKWQDWSCNEPGEYYIPKIDLRYTKGDPALGLPGGGRLLACPIAQLPCDKAFAPVELAHFYARLARGEILNIDDTRLLLAWLKRAPGDAVFLNIMPPGADVQVYVKGGTRQADATYRVNFFNEAGIVQTPQGEFALAIFMQRNPQWPGTEPMSRVARIIYDYFVSVHPPAGK
jgi:Beta-lactamase enzyme family